MNRCFFLITIDTEGDDIWNWKYPAEVRTENVRFLPRFQELCERFAFKPTYLTNYEIAIDPRFQRFGASILARNTGEIGLHVHAWNSPPLTGRHAWDCHQTYITELPLEFIREKMRRLTLLLEERFGKRPVSHRGGRYAFDGRVAKVLEELGYLIDCTVTPGVSWRRYTGSPDGTGGPDFVGFQLRPYFLDLDDIRRPGSSPVLEVPITIRANYPSWLRPASRHFPLQERVLRKLLGPSHSWLRPNGSNLKQLRNVVDWAISIDLPVLEFMLHSSELMPGGSPTFRTDDDIERLYTHLESLFDHIAARGIVGATLAEYRYHCGGAPHQQRLRRDDGNHRLVP